MRRMCGWGTEVREETLATIVGIEHKKIIGGGNRTYAFYRVRFPDGSERCIPMEELKTLNGQLTYDD